MNVSNSTVKPFLLYQNKEYSKDSGDKSSASKIVNGSQNLSYSEKEQVSKLQQRDSEVRAHEAAHIAAGGGVVSGGASFTYQKGPDNRLYAIGGEVPIKVQKGQTPQETLQIMRQVKAAALAPSNPSPQDYSVATKAALEEAKAMAELNKIQTNKILAGNAYENSEQNEQNRILDISA